MTYFKTSYIYPSHFHDLAKSYIVFSILYQNPEKTHDKRKTHALLSALLFIILYQNTCRKNRIDDQLKPFTFQFFAFAAVKRLHGQLGQLVQ